MEGRVTIDKLVNALMIALATFISYMVAVKGPAEITQAGGVWAFLWQPGWQAVSMFVGALGYQARNGSGLKP
jgi:hypothetical protein